MEALILAGGLGTRLRSVVSDRAKAVALAAGQPFLAHVIAHLAASGRVKRVILCVGHLAESVEHALGNECAGLPLVYSRESEPLGTGGAIKLAIQRLQPKPPFLALNGDTVLKLDLTALLSWHETHHADLSMALTYSYAAERFGTVRLDAARLTGFLEKGSAARGWINGGLYVVGAKARARLVAMPDKFSLEHDFFPAECAKLMCAGYRSRAKFLDIGVPEDYGRATTLLMAKRKR